MNKKLLPENITIALKSIFISSIGIFTICFGLVSIFSLFYDNSLFSSFMIESTLGHTFFINYFTDIILYYVGFIPSFCLFLILIRIGVLILLRYFHQIPYDYFFLKSFTAIFIGGMALGLITQTYGGLIGYVFNNHISLYLPVFFKFLLGVFLFFIFFMFICDLLNIDKNRIYIFFKTTFIKVINLFKNNTNKVLSKDIKEFKAKVVNKRKENKKQAPIAKIQNFKEQFQLPPPEFLELSIFNKNIITNELKRTAVLLEDKFEEFGVLGKVVGIKPGPIVTLYQFEPDLGVRVAKIAETVKDITRAMAAESIRIALIPKTNYVGVEIVNLRYETVRFRSLITNELFTQSKFKIPLALGVDIGGSPMYFDLVKMPHLLIAGRTGSGKSVFIQSLILSILYKFTPDECKLMIIDPKGVDFTLWDNIPHLISPVITDSYDSVNALKWCINEMEGRFKKLKEFGVQNIDGYNNAVIDMQNNNKKINKQVPIITDKDTNSFKLIQEEVALKTMPYLIIIIDEVADLMTIAKKDVELCIQRLAQKARAAGIHLITATQRPDTTVITGVIKANFPTRISFQARSRIDSMTTLGEKGAEQLISRGDMLFSEAGRNPVRIHGALVENSEINKIADFLRKQGKPTFIDITKETSNTESEFNINTGAKDSLYEQAKEIVIGDNKASISYLQRRLGIGYNKAANLIEQMEQEGIISGQDSTGKRHVL